MARTQACKPKKKVTFPRLQGSSNVTLHSLTLESSECVPLEVQLTAGMLFSRYTNHPLFKFLRTNP